ncbi:MAG: hypothetical protein C0602_08835 [Denitrovibrio sp.]|nr:MAG: hypothetical protein C0602_08835 [Denitrovibrio sp.]
MRNIAFLVIIIITVAIAVSCNIQEITGKKETEKTAGEKQVTGSIETPKVFTRVIERDSEDILNRINSLEESIDQKLSSLNLNVDNSEVIKQIEDLKQAQAITSAELVQASKSSKDSLKMRFNQLYAAMLAVTIAILAILLLVYRYLKKFIAESMLISSHKISPEPAPVVSGGTNGEESPIITAINETVKGLEAKIADAKFLFDPEKSVRLDSAQKALASSLSSEIAFLKKAGYEITSKHSFITAVEKVNDKNYSEASQILEDIKASEDKYAPAYFLAGYIAYVTRKYDIAAANLKTACELDPKNAAYLISYGNACLKEKKFTEAADALKNAVELKPDDASTWNNLAHAYILSDKIDEAVEAFSKATDLKPEFHEALHNLGLALGKLKKYTEALDAFEKAITAKEDKHESMYNAACVYALLGKREGALSNLKKAIALDPAYAAKAKKDKDFSSFKADEEFKEITK